MKIYIMESCDCEKNKNWFNNRLFVYSFKMVYFNYLKNGLIVMYKKLKLEIDIYMSKRQKFMLQRLQIKYNLQSLKNKEYY